MEPPREGSPAAKLTRPRLVFPIAQGTASHYSTHEGVRPRPRLVTINADGTSYYSTHEGVRAKSAYPSTCTRPSGYIPGVAGRSTGPMPKGAWLLPAQGKVTQSSSAPPGSTLVRDQAQVQGCSVEGQGACSDTRVVPTTDAGDRATNFVPSEAVLI